MKIKGAQYFIDLESRYFQEDFLLVYVFSRHMHRLPVLKHLLWIKFCPGIRIYRGMYF